jgi:hypothetical protein
MRRTRKTLSSTCLGRSPVNQLSRRPSRFDPRIALSRTKLAASHRPVAGCNQRSTMRAITKVVFILLSIIIVGEPANATKRRHVHQTSTAAQNEQIGFPFFNPFIAAYSPSTKPSYSGSSGGRPHAWCGWWARQQVGQDPGPEFNLVSSWRKWGNLTGPVPGAIAIWRGARHVGKVVSIDGGEVCTTSGNSGTATGVGTRCEPLTHFEQFRI